MSILTRTCQYGELIGWVQKRSQEQGLMNLLMSVPVPPEGVCHRFFFFFFFFLGGG